MSTGNKVLKRIGIAVGAIIGLMVVAAIAVPLFVHVDDYRPRLVQAVNEKINGKLELGKLSLSLWGQVRVNVDGFTLLDSQGRKVVAAQDVYFHLPLLSLLSGSPVLTFKMKHPEVNVIKDRTGKMNVLTLMKPQAAPSSAPAPSASPAPSTTGDHSLPAIAMRARLGVQLIDATVQYQDELAKLTSTLQDLNIDVKDISLTHPTQVAIWANLDTKMGKSLTVQGPARISAEAKPVFAGTALQSLSGSFKVDLDKLRIEIPGLFQKTAAIPANLTGSFHYQGQSASLDDLVIRFHNAEVKAAAGVSGLGAAAGPAIRFSAKSNPIELHPWNELVPMLKDYNLGGTADLDADASGTATAPQYHADLSVRALTAKAPMLKAEPRIDASVKVVTNAVQSLRLAMNAPGNDLLITGSIAGFTAPKIDVQVQSSQMDLDQLVDMPQVPAKGMPGTKSESAEPTASGPQGKPANVDAMLEPVRQNPMLAGTTANLGFHFKQIKVRQVRMSGLEGRLTFKNLALALESFRVGVFNGAIDASLAAQLKPRMPTYRFHLGVSNLDLKEAVASQMVTFKNTLLGHASFKVDGTGASFNTETAQKNLNAKGNMAVTQAMFATLDVGKMVTDAISKTVSQLSSKIPGIKGLKLPAPGSIDTKYQSITADFTIASAVFSAPNFYAKSEHGIDLKGDTKVGLLDKSLKANWLVIDTYNVTGARDLSVDQGGVHVAHILAEGNNPVQFPVVIGGSLFAPQPSYTAVPEVLGKVALNNVGQAAKGKAQAEMQKAAQDQLKKVGAPPAVQNAVRDLGKKLFGH